MNNSPRGPFAQPTYSELEEEVRQLRAALLIYKALVNKLSAAADLNEPVQPVERSRSYPLSRAC